MILDVWIPTNKSIKFDTIPEGVTIDIALPVIADPAVTYKVISGKLPPGVLLDNSTLIGTPNEIADDTTYTFCIRASKTVNNVTSIADRTFSLPVTGPDSPIILTNPGLLDIGPAKQLYVVDKSIVNYQIEASDFDLTAGQSLRYFINRGDGELPDGLTLTQDGRIIGMTNAVTSLTPESGTGSFDTGYFDSSPFDFAVIQKEIGYDIYLYDNTIYDMFKPRRAKSISRRYDFAVSVTDGVLTPKRIFKILVVNENFFRTDTDELLSNVGLFTADVSYLTAPVWITPSDLGTYRANNYITLILDVYSTGLIFYSIDDLKKLPPGMEFDERTGEVFGYVPYQPAITTTYSFTITASKHGDETKNEINSSSRTFTIKIIGEIDSIITWNTESNLGTIKPSYTSLLNVQAVSNIPDAVVMHSIVKGMLPPGLTMSTDGEIYGTVSSLSNRLSFDLNRTYFDVKTSLISFDNGTTTFNTNGNTAFTTVISIPPLDNGNTTFDQSPRTTFDKQYFKPGLTTIDYRLNNPTSFDNKKTTIDRSFTFTVEARDQYYYSATQKSFTINVDSSSRNFYDNIIVKPFMDLTRRNTWDNFINNTSIFEPDLIYRPYDPEFGVQTDLSMLIYAGIQSSTVLDYINQMKNNYKNKRFHIGEVKKAIALIPGTHQPVYEVVYIKIIDPTESVNRHLSKNTIVNHTVYHPSSVTAWQRSLSVVNKTNGDLLPLWMRSIQPNDRAELGYILAVPLCFCKVGSADKIMLNIKHSNFKFNLLDFVIDRIIIHSTSSYTDKYIIFNNNRNNI